MKRLKDHIKESMEQDKKLHELKELKKKYWSLFEEINGEQVATTAEAAMMEARNILESIQQDRFALMDSVLKIHDEESEAGKGNYLHALEFFAEQIFYKEDKIKSVLSKLLRSVNEFRK